MNVKAIVFSVVLLVSGCATYESQPLPDKPLWPQNINRLESSDLRLLTQTSGPFIFNPNDGLNVLEVAAVAVTHNPGLQLARDAAGVTKAQAFQAGLLPDPTLILYPQAPINGGVGSNSMASEYGIFYNISALITHSTVLHDSHSTAQKADLDLLWQEWLVLSQVQVLFEKICTNETILVWLNKKEAILKQIEEAQQQALLRKDVELSATAVNTLLLKETAKQRLELQRVIMQDRYLLNQLLGLPPETKLQLTNDLTLPVLAADHIKNQLDQVTRIRPDLLALQKGYEAQDYRLREAILSQFPSINFGFTKLRDNGAVNYNGFDLSISLPIFNRNQGNVAIAKATRQQLYDEYQNRLNMAFSDVHRLSHDLALLQQQIPLMTDSLHTLSVLSVGGQSAFQRQDLDIPSYGQLSINELDKKIELEIIKQVLLEQNIQLSMLIGEPLSNWVEK
ncbi:MAG: hypothetical protein B7Z60_01635 [Ferrovum sp. 37-45-19]|jgi:outer membrane protein TolC|uniref:TolC family protein n=1 Tax=Ferrovum sp. JA12 TaxID=1356299 RepID=UPI000702A123|nr:TolC family protein [Ferrovum sp. JA12]OYV80711.1 MAG: hypothetical protein B7Z65_00520 [Ferrovum sp. 21-44-67]OYV95262.1 MAG: hypothetical protein B7Z60_01635 [Ferrovum sp. 37-45-19]OZB33718.1 MAG: hypothetical protein B7X47_03030 [Ferrovum sp. 34-44-207]HQT80769.1 TolC family protein [Ferrovaceae bacterium]KRH79863.1 outer membrane efflux protein [Ferrovum sp. JA12]